MTEHSQYISDLETQDLILRSKIEELIKDKEKLENQLAYNESKIERMWKVGGICPYIVTVNVDTGKEGIYDKVDFPLNLRYDIFNFLKITYPIIFSDNEVSSIVIRRNTFSVADCSNLSYSLYQTPRLMFSKFANGYTTVPLSSSKEMTQISKLFYGKRSDILTVPNIESRKTMSELIQIVIDYLDKKVQDPGDY